MNRIVSRSLLIAAGLVAFAGSAQAQTANTTFQVTTTVAAACTVSATALSFGTYSSAGNNDASSTMDVNCSTGTAYNVGLNAGTGTGATVASRKMSNGAALLNYTLYRDAARSTVWGSTAGTDTATGTGSGAAQTLTVYGRVPGSQSASAGSYTDTITVAVTF